jgi:hypothetical protein
VRPWLAIDEAGCIALLEGAVAPRDAPCDDEVSGLVIAVALRRIADGHSLPRLAASTNLGAGTLLWIDPARGAATYRASPVGAGDLRDACVVLREHEPRLLLAREALVLADDDAIVSALDPRALRAWLNSEGWPHLFRFRADAADPRYVRTSTPDEPLLVQDLPDEAQQRLRRARLSLRFARTKELFLDDHVEARRLVDRSPPAAANAPPRTPSSSLEAERRTRMARMAAAALVSAAVHAIALWLGR